MSTRRRAGTWQDEVARSFSRLFSRSSSQEKEEESSKDPGEEQDKGDRSLSRLFFRSSSQEKKDGNDRAEHGEEQERSHSPSRLFFRRVAQEGKGVNDNASPAKGNKEEQDRSKNLSRLITKTSSQEKDEENDSSRGATEEDQSRYEDNHSNLTLGRHEDLSSTEPEHVTREPTSSLPTHNISEPEEEKEEEFAPNSKVLDSEKQSRENFFHFIGNLFHFSPKSSLGNLKQGNGVQESCREHEEAQVKNSLDKEDLYQEPTQDDHSRTEEDSEQNTARQQEQEDSGVAGGETSKDILENVDAAVIDPPKLNGHVQDAPAITYGTYRGSRRIRKLLKRRADVNSPIPEKEENPETSSAGETNTENCLMLHEWVKMDPVPDRNCQDEIPPSKIHKKMQSKLEPREQNLQLHNDDTTIQNAKSSKFENDLEMEANGWSECSPSEEVHPENISEVVEGQQPNIETNIKDVLQLNAKESSKYLQPITVESLEDLHPTLGGSSNILSHIKQNGENSQNHSLESSISENLEPNIERQYADIEPKELDISDTVRHQQLNSKQSDHQPNIKESVRFPEILETNTDDDVTSETDLSLKEAQNLLLNTKGKMVECMTEHIHVTSDSSDSEKYEKFSVSDNLQPEAEDTLMRTEELEESSEENTEVSIDLGGSGAVDLQSALKQSNLEKVLDSQDWAGNQKEVEVNVHSEDILHKNSSNILHPTAHNILERSIDKNCEGLNSSTSDYLKLELGRTPNTVDLQSEGAFASRSTVDVKPNTLGNSEKGEQLQLYRDRHPKEPDHELKGTVLDKTLSESEGIPNLHLQLIKMPRTSEDPKLIENIVDLPTNANIIPESDVKNNDKLIKTELEPNSKVSCQLNELNNTLLEKVSSESDLPNLALQLNQTSKTAKDLNQTENVEHLETISNIIPENDEELLKTEPQTNTKLSFQLKELNNTFSDKASVLEDIPKLNAHLSETFRTSENLQQTGNIKCLHKNTNVIPENDLKDGELLQPNPKVTIQLNGNSDESPIKSGIISKMIENQKTNIHIVSNVSDGIQSEVKEPSKVNLHLEPKSGFHFSELGNDSFGFKVSQRHEFDEELSETGHSNDFTNEDNGAIMIQNIKSANFLQNTDNTNVPESYLNETSSFNKDHEVVTSRDISFDNGIECRSPSPHTISGSPSSVDCNDVQFDSPNDSGIVSSQAYTPDEHIQLKTFHSEIFNKNAPDPFAVLHKSEEALAPKPNSSFNVRTVPISQNKEPIININTVPEGTCGSLADGCTDNSLRETTIEISTPDRLSKENSDIFVAKVSMKTVNIEEVKLPYVLRSDIISVAKLESPTFTQEVICIPNLSPPPTCTENTFQVENKKDFVINEELPSNRWDYMTLNKCEKFPKNCFLEADGLPTCKDSELTINRVKDLPSKDSTDNISQFTYIQKELPKISDKSPEVLIENLKNNNINVCSSDNIRNVSLQTLKSEKELANETIMSNDSLKELGESLSELTPDTKMNHKEKLNSLLLHSALLHDVSDKTEIISSRPTNAKFILPVEDHSKSSNELFEKKANEIIFSVLHSAVGEIQNINQSLTDIQHIIESQSEKRKDLEDHPDEILDKCTQKPSDQILIDDTDLIMSMAVGIVNDVISSSKQMVVTNIIPTVLKKDLDKYEAAPQKTITSLNDVSTNNQNGPVEDSANSNHDVPSLGCDNIVHLPSCEINSNVLGSTEGSQILDSRQEIEPNLLNKLDSRVTKDMSQSDVGSTIEITVLRSTDDEELPSFSRNSVKVDTHNSIDERYTNGDLNFDDKSCDTHIESISLETEGSMEDFIYNNIDEESSNFAELCDFLHFSVYNSHYVEISGSDDESTDEENDGGSDQASGNDSFLPVQSRRVKIYPYALSPIYEDDSVCEEAMSNSSSPRYNKGAAASNSGHDHISILSLLQSVSDRLKEADLEDTSHEEIYSSSSSEVPIASDRFNKEGSHELEDITCTSKTTLDDDEKASSGARSGLFISKSFVENKSNPALGRQSFLLNLASQPDISGKKSSNSVQCFSSETSASPKSESNPNQSTDPSPSTIAVNSLTSDSALPTQSSATDKKPRVTPKSVYYQYFHATQNYLSSTEKNESHTQEKLENSKIRAESDTNAADSDTLKFNPRPGKVILSDIIDQENKIELKADVLDATSWAFPHGVNIRVIRGCWILYEKPHFEGRAHVLEEGEAVLRHLWDSPKINDKQDKITIGSVRRVVKDYLPEVVISSLQDPSDTIYIRTEVPSLENLVGRHPRSLEVNSGVWLAYTEPQYSGTVTALEEGCKLCQIQDSGLKSMRPLKMGGLKVQLPSDPKIILYEKAHFEGWSREITEHVSAIGSLTCDGENGSCQDIGSIQVIGGIWVGYENERYKGHQYLLEEGDYEDWQAWGGYTNTLQSIRFLQADFLEASVTLCETDEEDEKQINLFNQAIPDLELAGYKTRTQCINVKQGMWVAYEQKHFCGEQYILEKGRYKTYMDWGGSNNIILSIRPVLLEPLGRNDAKHLIKVYSRTEFQGEDMDFTEGLSEFTSFMPMSFKVLRGCWLLCYGSDGDDNLCVLEEGHFPDLASCGCPTAEIKSIKPIDYVFAEPSLSLFALDSCEGRQLYFEDAVTSVLSKDLHFYAASVWVRRGLWIAFESANFLGRQMLLDPQQILNWSQFSGWKAIGSLRPLKQPSVYFMIKNRDNDKYLTVTGKLADSRATFVSVSPRNGQTTQIWYFCRGFLKSKANDSCLDVIGGKNIPGSKVSLWSEHGKTRQKWKIDKGGTISSYISDDLVLDLKGGIYYDKNYIVVNRVQDNALTQKWDIELL
ncbi:very large A-kinase anchor protein [Ranitomeya imitator]|uniref:very large A-kinase anchor protein n=1 Tax=Ranitomeya imitator TaxID=111125 RepID=UPI0037E8EBF2